MKTLKSVIVSLGFFLAVALTASAQITLSSMEGTRTNIEGQTGKVVVLAIGASWLPLSAKQAEYTNALARKYAGKEVVFYFVAVDSANASSKNYATNEAVKKFAFDNKLTATILRDSDGSATLRKYSVEQVPSFVILDKSGTQVGTPFGGLDPKSDITIQISRAIDKLL